MTTSEKAGCLFFLIWFIILILALLPLMLGLDF